MTDKCDLGLLTDLKGSGTLQSDLLKRIDEMAAKLTAKDPTKPPAIHYATAAQRVAAEMKGEAANYKAQLVTSYKAREDKFTSLGLEVANGTSPEKAFRLILGGVTDGSEATRSRAIAKLVMDVEKAGLLPNLHLLSGRDRSFTLDFMRELQQLNKKIKPEVGVTRNKAAIELASIVDRHTRLHRAELKAMGFRTADLEGRIFKQLWARERTLASAPDANSFVALLRDRVARIGDTFAEDLSDAELTTTLKDRYNEILGTSLEEPVLSAREMVSERRTYAVRQGLSREIYFKTVEDELFVLENFGGGDVESLLTETIGDLAKQVHLTQEMGVNSRSTTYAMIAKAGELGADTSRIFRGAGTMGVLTPQNILNGMNGFFDQEPSNPKVDRWGTTIANFARATFLPLSSLNSITDLPTLNNATRRHALPAAGNIANAVKRMIAGIDLPKELMAEAAGIIEAESVHALGSLHRYTTLPGLDNAVYNGSVWVADKTFQWNGLNRVTRALKQTAYNQYSGMLATAVEAKVPWEKLPQPTRQLLVRAGMLDKDWATLLTKSDAVFKDGPIKFLDTGKLDYRLGNKVNAAVSRFVSGEAVLTPDALSRLYLDLGTQRGTVPNAVIRQMTFLLGYPVAFMRQGFAREMEVNGVMSSGMLKYAAALTFYGTVLSVARDFAMGRDRDYSDPEILTQLVMEGVMRGGALTIYGETLWKTVGAERGAHHLLFGEDAKYKMASSAPFDPTSDLLVGGGVEWLWTALSGTTRGTYNLVMGETDKGVEQLLSTARRSVPTFVPGVKPILDATLFDYFAEMAGSSMMRKIESRWNAPTGGDFLLTDFNP